MNNAGWLYDNYFCALRKSDVKIEHVTMFIHRSLYTILLVLLMPLSVKARAIHPPTSEELVTRSPIICNGRVVAIENTLEKGMVVLPHYENNFSIPVEFWKARIQVLSTFKGKAPDEIELRFHQIDQHPTTGGSIAISDGPLLISLRPKERCRFYLKSVPGQKWFVGVLDGDFDDSYAVQSLTDVEPDDSPPPLSKAEAIKCAAEYLRKFRPEMSVSADSSDISEWEGRWNVRFWWPPAKSHESEPDAHIWVVGQGLIDHPSWVSDGSGIRVGDLKPADMGREYWVYLKPDLHDKFYSMSTLEPMILRCHLKNVTSQNVVLADVWQLDTSLTWPTLTIPADDIRLFQRLISEATPGSTATR